MDNTWLRELAEDEKMQLVGNREDFPAVLNFEYNYLFMLAKQNRLYGVVLQIKDVYETMIKIPCVMAMIILTEQYSEQPEVYGDLMNYVITKPLAMGDWEVIAGMIVKISRKYPLPDVLIKLLKKTRKMFNADIEGRNIINWRNDTLGHGALKFENDPSYQNEVTAVFNALRDYYMTADYDGLYITAGKRKLTGFTTDLESSDDPIILHADRQEYPVSEFILGRDLQCFFFDSHYMRRMKTKFSAYMGGNEFTEERKYFKDLYQKIERAELDRHFVDQDVTTRAEEQMMACLNQPDEYQIPVSLIRKLNDMMEELEQGIILIRMERGTGKTAFASRMDGLHYARPLIDNALSRTYHLSDTVLNGIDDFFYALNFSFRHSYHTKDDIYRTAQALPELKPDVSSALLAEFLNSYHRIYKRDYTLLVIDGIDELTADTEGLLNSIPVSDQLDEGVFVILLSRFADESTVKEQNAGYIETVMEKADRVIDIRREDALNTEPMRSYIKQQTDSCDHPDELIRQSDYRFLYLKPAVLLHNRTVLETSDETSFVRSYLQYLMSLYSEAQRKKVEELLSVIALFRGITFDEYSRYLTGDPVSYTLIGILNDLMPLLTVRRDPKGNQYEYADQAYRDFVLCEYPEAIKKVTDSFDMFLNEQLYRVMNNIPAKRKHKAGLMYSEFNEYSIIDDYGKTYHDLELNRQEKAALDFYSRTLNTLCGLSDEEHAYYSIRTLLTLAGQLSYEEDYEFGYRKTVYIHLLKHICSVLIRQAQMKESGISAMADTLSDTSRKNLRIDMRLLREYSKLCDCVLDNISEIADQKAYYWILNDVHLSSEEYAGIAEKINIEDFVRYQIASNGMYTDLSGLENFDDFNEELKEQIIRIKERRYTKESDPLLSEDELRSEIHRDVTLLNEMQRNIDTSIGFDYELVHVFSALAEYKRNKRLKEDIHELCKAYYSCLCAWAEHDSAEKLFRILPYEKKYETFTLIIRELFADECADQLVRWADLMYAEQQRLYPDKVRLNADISKSLLMHAANEYYAARNTDCMIETAEKIICSYEHEYEYYFPDGDHWEDFWEGFWTEYRNNEMSSGVSMPLFCWCSDNVMILINMYRHSDRTESLEKLMNKLIPSVAVLFETGERTGSDLEDMERDYFRFLYFCRQVFTDSIDEFENLAVKLREKHSKNIRNFLRALSGESDFKQFEREIEQYITCDWQLYDSEAGISRCQELIQLIKQYQDSADPVMDEALDNEISFIQGYIIDFKNNSSKVLYREEPISPDQITFPV